jgi:hypothetical protein
MPGSKRNPARVYVDAKIKGMHDEKLPKEAYVGYYVEETGEHNEEPTNADESDDAEIQAVLFAFKELGKKFDKLTIICDHQSVVSEANRPTVKKPSARLAHLRTVLHENQSTIELKALQTNPAHKTVTEYVNRLKLDSTSS